MRSAPKPVAPKKPASKRPVAKKPAVKKAVEVVAPKKRGRKPGDANNFVPTDDQRKIVEMAASMRMPHDEIALLIINPRTKKHIDFKTLTKVFETEIKAGYSKLRMSIHMAKVSEALKGNPTLIIWAEKTLFGVRENVDVMVPEEPDDGEDVIKKARRIAFTLALGAHQAVKTTVLDDKS